MSMTYISYASQEKLMDVLEKDNIVNDLRIPKTLKPTLKNILIMGQVWGRRGNTKLITVVLFTNQYNNNEEVKEEIRRIVIEEERGSKLVFHKTSSILTINIFSRNLASILKGVNSMLQYLITELDIAEDLISTSISTDLPNWKGANYYTTDIYTLLNIVQTRNIDSQHGIIYLDPDKLEDTEILTLIQIALTVYPRIIIKLECDEISKEFLIKRIQNLVLETKTLINLTDINKILIAQK